MKGKKAKEVWNWFDNYYQGEREKELYSHLPGRVNSLWEAARGQSPYEKQAHVTAHC